MDNKTKAIVAIAVVVLLTAIGGGVYYWQQKKNHTATEVPLTDSAALNLPTGNGGVPMLDLSNLPKADSVLIPILSKTLDEAFAASEKKDYAALASMIIYRGPDSLRMGYDVFNYKSNYEKSIVRITGETFNAWNKDVQTREYARAFEMPIPDGRSMPVLEVIFISRKSVNRKFFAFLEVNGQFRISDVTSYL
ncbi:MAG: hypothetical protein IPH78_03080 [Bacteroidetes bacterium]|nr:hypothetical protein [Bacteroidota bacterium]MBK8657597.1 hypothetical protein [Bacteroidota bacterium]